MYPTKNLREAGLDREMRRAIRRTPRSVYSAMVPLITILLSFGLAMPNGGTVFALLENRRARIGSNGARSANANGKSFASNAIENPHASSVGSAHDIRNIANEGGPLKEYTLPRLSTRRLNRQLQEPTPAPAADLLMEELGDLAEVAEELEEGEPTAETVEQLVETIEGGKNC